MEIGGWLLQNWFNLLSAIGIIAGLIFTAVSLRSETKTRRVANLLAITTNHREIWKKCIWLSWIHAVFGNESSQCLELLGPDV